MTSSGVVDDNEPVIDGFCFDDLYGYTVDEKNALARSGNVFLTEFRALTKTGHECTFSGAILAESRYLAEREAARRNLGERVVGALRGVIAGDE